MSYADSLLAGGEKVLLRSTQHPFVLLRAIFEFILFTIVAMVIIIGGGSLAAGNQMIGQISLGVGLIVLAIGLIRMTFRWFAWRCEEYLVTNRRIMKVEGIINKRSADSSLEKINDAVLSQGLFGRIFGFGDLDIMTAAENTVDQFRILRSPVEFKKAMLEAKQDYLMSGGNIG